MFASPALAALRLEGGASSSPQPHPGSGSGAAAAAATTVSQSFQFATANGQLAAAAAEDDAASSGGDSDGMVSEAAVVARTLTRASALQKDREELRGQVRDLSQELRDLKGKQKHMARHMQAAHTEGGLAGSPLPAQPPRQRQQQQPARAVAPADASEAGSEGDAALAEQCQLHAAEERHLRSEVELLNRKVNGGIACCASCQVPGRLHT